MQLLGQVRRTECFECFRDGFRNATHGAAESDSGESPPGTEEKGPNAAIHHDADQVLELGSTTEDEPALKAPDAHTDKYTRPPTGDVLPSQNSIYP
jgi:hypothetical protein